MARKHGAARSGTARREQLRPRRYRASRYRASGKLEDKVALITSGDSGIGRAVALQYAREDADVAIVQIPDGERVIPRLPIAGRAVRLWWTICIGWQSPRAAQLSPRRDVALDTRW